MMSRATYDRYFDDPGVDTLGLYLDDGVSADDVVASIKALSAGRQVIRVDSNVRIRELSLEIFDQTFVITNVLYWLAMGVAFIGILSTLMSLQLERRREIGLLRAVGATRRQTRTMIMGEATLMGIIGGVCGLVAGVGLVMIFVVTYGSNSWGVTFPLWPAAFDAALPAFASGMVGLILAPFIAAGAAWLPARRILREQPVESLIIE